MNNDRERYLSTSEVKQLLNHISDFRELLFVKLALSTGGRLQTILHIKKKDINLARGSVLLQDLKNNSTYTGFLHDDVKDMLEKYLPTLKGDEYVIGRKRTRLSDNAMARTIRPTLNKLFNQGLAKDDRKNRVVIHTFRHTFASHLAINGTPIFTIQKLMNHRDIKMTMRYAKLAPDSGMDWDGYGEEFIHMTLMYIKRTINYFIYLDILSQFKISTFQSLNRVICTSFCYFSIFYPF